MESQAHGDKDHICDLSCAHQEAQRQARLAAQKLVFADMSDDALDSLAKRAAVGKGKDRTARYILEGLKTQGAEEKQKIRAALIAAQIEKSGLQPSDEERADLDRRIATHQTNPPALHTLHFLLCDEDALRPEAAAAFRKTDASISKAEASDTVFRQELGKAWTELAKAEEGGGEVLHGGYNSLCAQNGVSLVAVLDPWTLYRLQAAFSLFEVWPAWCEFHALRLISNWAARQPDAGVPDGLPKGRAETALKRNLEDWLGTEPQGAIRYLTPEAEEWARHRPTWRHWAEGPWEGHHHCDGGDPETAEADARAEATGEDDGMCSWAARMAHEMETRGLADQTGAFRKRQRELWAKDPASTRRLWDDPLYGIKNLAVALWPRTRDELEREAEHDRGVLRASTGLVTTLGMARSIGGHVVGAEILVTPPEGIALSLPFDGANLRVTQRGGGVVGLRQVLKDRALRTYLATLVLFQDAGGRNDGSFEIDGPGTILDVTGATKQEEHRAGRTILRFHSKETRAVAEDLELFSQVRVRSVGTLEAKAGDPLVDELRDRRSGRTAFYAHSRLIVGELRSNYIRIPKAVCKLDAIDVPRALGIAAIARKQMVRHLMSDASIEAPIGDWLEAAGVDAQEQTRKIGRSFWPSIARELSRVAEAGKLGRISAAGTGRDMVLSLALEPSLRISYAPLLKNAIAQQKAKRAAKVRKHLGP